MLPDGDVVPRRPHRARFDQHHVDAELRDLHPQRVAEPLDRVLAGVIERAAGQRDPAAHRRDVQDPTGLARRIPGSTSWVSRTRPKKFVSNCRRMSSIGTCSTGPYSP